ncbi:MAG: long-chain acyl-CoA synthetase [Paraglaciecola sp.]|jgi:long-chain acyl-CoA synthetase
MDFQRLFDILPYQLAKYPQKIALAHFVENRWKNYSTKAIIESVQQLSAGLLDLGLKKGQTVGIMTPIGSPIFIFLDFALLQIGVVVVPIHATINKDQLIYILKDTNLKYCFVANQKLYDKLMGVRANALHLKEIYSFEKLQNVPHWKELLTVPNEQHLGELQTYRGVIHEDDLATIIYTSDTTSMPKGVLLSHKNIVSNIKSVLAIFPINQEKRVLSFLPVSHIFERMTNYLYIAAGASLYYSNHIENMADDLKKVRPHFFTAVPHLIEKIYDGILEEGSKKGKLDKKTLNWAIKLGERFQSDTPISLLYWLQSVLANLLVYRHWRKKIGGKVEGIVVGTAHLQPKLSRLFNAAGIHIREGYDLTESSPVVKFDTVWIPTPGMKVKTKDKKEANRGGSK